MLPCIAQTYVSVTTERQFILLLYQGRWRGKGAELVAGCDE